MTTAKLFWSSDAQAVLLPEAFHFDGSELRIRRQGAAVILEPIANDWTWLDALAGPLDADFQQAAGEDQPMGQEQPGFGQLTD